LLSRIARRHVQPLAGLPQEIAIERIVVVAEEYFFAPVAALT